MQEPTSRGDAIKALNFTLRVYNDLLSELRDKRNQINLQREQKEIDFRQYWDLRMGLECRIQDTIEKRDAVMREMVVAFTNKLILR
jgi:hypothetical protein